MQHRQYRYQTQYPIDVQTPMGPQQGRVIDVNNGGARIAGMRGLRRGHKVHVTILSLRVEAVVCWVSGERAGLLFRPHLSDMQVDTLRYRRDARMGQHRGRTSFSFAEMR